MKFKKLILLVIIALCLCLSSATHNIFAMGESSKFIFAQLKYRGGNWDVRTDSGKRLIWELIRQTGVEAKLQSVIVTPESNEIFEYPFIYMAGDKGFEPFNDIELKNMKRYLAFGGTMLVDDSFGKEGVGFDESIRREIKRLFPHTKLEILKKNHTIFRSFFLLTKCAGRVDNFPYLQGVTMDDRTAVIYSQNDLGGAWARDNFGNWEFEVVPGGYRQRKKSFHLGINILMYVLTGNYKQDQVHMPFILRRQK